MLIMMMTIHVMMNSKQNNSRTRTTEKKHATTKTKYATTTQQPRNHHTHHHNDHKLHNSGKGDLNRPRSHSYDATQRLKIKLEVDTDPPAGAVDEVRTLLIPIPFQTRLYQLPSLFAGKLHAILCRDWKTRVKGRDFFDFIWYLGKGVPCHLPHLQSRMEQTGHWTEAMPLDETALKQRLSWRFEEVDFDQARDDVRPFVRDADALALWSRDFFLSLAAQVRGESTSLPLGTA